MYTMCWSVVKFTVVQTRVFGQMDEKQVQLIIQEKNLAIEQNNQSKLLIEKLEQELQTLKDLQPTSSKNIVNIVQKEYTEIINSLRDKLKTLQDKYKEEIRINSKKDGEIAILTKRTDELSSKLKQIETEFFNCNNLLKQEREKCLTLENDFIKLQNESFSLEKKYSCVRILENERDKLINDNHKLSSDCNELEIALEICHQKMRGYDDEINLYCKCLKQMEQDKKVSEENEKIEKELNNELQKRIESMNSTLKILQKNLDSKEELIRKNVENLIGHFSIDNESKEPHDNYFNESNIEEENYSNEFLQLRVLLSNFKKELEDCIAEKYRLEMKLQTTVSNMEKYRGYIREANNMIKCLGKKLDDQEEIIKKMNSRKDVEKCVQKIGNTNAELQKHIHSQEQLHKKWKSEVTELINRFKNRISFLNSKYKKTQKENVKLKKCLNKYLQGDAYNSGR